MPVATPKSNPPSDAEHPTPVVAEFVIRNVKEFSALYQTTSPHGGVFCPTRKKVTIGSPIGVKVRLGRRQPPLQLYGKVIWRRPGRHLDKIRAGIGVEFFATEQVKCEYILQLARGDGIRSRRRHERVPVDLPVNWHVAGGTEGIAARLRDIGRGGAFVHSEMPVSNDDQVVLEIAPPGAEVPMAFTARVAWRGKYGDAHGFGIEWRARDAGGGRRIRELVRRLSTNQTPPTH